MIRHIHRVILLAAVASVGASRAAAQGAKPARAAPIADISMDQMAVIAPRVAALRAIPSTLAIRVGQTIQLDSIHLIAMDTQGHDIGRLRAFNFGIKPGEAATAVPRQVTGGRVGVTELRLSYPSAPWGKRVQERPFTIVKVTVTP